MNVLSSTGSDRVATVFLAEVRENLFVEFLESVQPPIPREKKWVLIVSTLFGCPVRCPICDAGDFYRGKLTKEEILGQIDFLVRRRYPDGYIPAGKFKIQFARMGEPSFNMAVLEVLKELPGLYKSPGLIPCISTVAPTVSEDFFENLLEIKKKYYGRMFQLQFSIHSTNPEERDFFIPIKKWSFEKIAEYGRRFHGGNGRKITLNFAPTERTSIDPDILFEYFDPKIFFIKLTPLNPTYLVAKNNLSSYIDPSQEGRKYPLVENLRALGFEVLVSIGEMEENKIGSNCGQYIRHHLEENSRGNRLKDGYSFEIKQL